MKTEEAVDLAAQLLPTVVNGVVAITQLIQSIQTANKAGTDISDADMARVDTLVTQAESDWATIVAGAKARLAALPAPPSP